MRASAPMLTDCCPALGTTPNALGTAQAVKRNTPAASSEFPRREPDPSCDLLGAMLECSAAAVLVATVASPGGEMVYARRIAARRGSPCSEQQPDEPAARKRGVCQRFTRQRSRPRCVVPMGLAGDDGAGATRQCGRMGTITNTQGWQFRIRGCVMVL